MAALCIHNRDPTATIALAAITAIVTAAMGTRHADATDRTGTEMWACTIHGITVPCSQGWYLARRSRPALPLPRFEACLGFGPMSRRPRWRIVGRGKRITLNHCRGTRTMWSDKCTRYREMCCHLRVPHRRQKGYVPCSMIWRVCRLLSFHAVGLPVSLRGRCRVENTRRSLALFGTV